MGAVLPPAGNGGSDGMPAHESQPEHISFAQLPLLNRHQLAHFGGSHASVTAASCALTTPTTTSTAYRASRCMASEESEGRADGGRRGGYERDAKHEVAIMHKSLDEGFYFISES